MEPWSVRDGARRLAERAAEAGVSGAWELLARTPREIDAELCAWSARRRAAREEAELLAWLTGGYALLSVHAPKRYPRRPNIPSRGAPRMTDEEMKRTFAGMAAERRVTDGGG